MFEFMTIKPNPAPKRLNLEDIGDENHRSQAAKVYDIILAKIDLNSDEDKKAAESPRTTSLSTDPQREDLILENKPSQELHEDIDLIVTDNEALLEIDSPTLSHHQVLAKSANLEQEKDLDSETFYEPDDIKQEKPKTLKNAFSLLKSESKGNGKASGKKKHYKINFNPNWLNSQNDDYKDWVAEVKGKPKRFLDLACETEYDCEYLCDHEKKPIHLEKYQAWKKSLENNLTLDKDVALANKLTRLQAKVVLFLVSKNAPMSWGEEIGELFQSVFPENSELKNLKLFPKKCNWIAETLAECSKESLYSFLKRQAFSLLFDETSTRKYKYGAFMARIVNQDFTEIESMLLNLHEVPKGDADSIYKT